MRILLIALGFSLLTACGQKTSEEHFAAAQQFVAENKLNSAVLELKNAIQQDPKSAQARFELGRIYLAQKKYESAEKELNRAMEFGYPASKVIPLLSQAYQNTGAYAALSEIDHTNSGMTPEEEVEVGFFKLQSLIQLEKIEEAKTLIAELKAIEADSVYSGLTEVYEMVLAENNELAVQRVEELKATYPNNADLLKLQGQLYLRLNKTELAAQVYQEYIKAFPDDTQIVFVLAKLLVDSGKIVEAEPYVDQLLAINEENALLNQLKAVISAAKDDHPAAQKYAEKAIQSGRGDPVLRLVAGYAAYLQKDYEAANRHLSYIASSLPENHPGLKMLAASQLELGLSSDASDVLENVDSLSEQDAMLFSKTGYELIRSGNIKQAKEVVERSAEISRTAEDLTRLGVLRLSLNDIDGIVDLEKALAKSPDLEVTKTTLANAYLMTNQLDKAEALANEWKQNSPDDFKAYMLAGEVLSKQKQYDAALAEYQKADQLEPENGLIKLAITNLDFLKGDMAKGEAGLNDILKRKPDFIPALASYYSVKKSQGLGKEGMQPALNAKKTNPDDPQLIVLLGRMYLAQEQYQQAVDMVNQLPENGDTPSNYWLIKGQALLRLGNIANAQAHYDKWLEVAPNSKQGVIGKLLLLDTENKFADGLKLAKSFLEVRDDLEVKLLNEHFLLMTGDFKQAQVEYDKLPDGVKELPVVQSFKARLLLADKKFDEALPYSTVAYENLTNSRNLIMLTANLENLNKKSEAISLLNKHIEQFPNDVVARMMLAERQIAVSQDDAISQYEAIIAVNPNNFVVLNNLAYLYTQEGRFAEAEKHARKAVEQKPENPDALDTLAQTLVKQKKYDEALKFYDRAINDNMKNDEIYLNYVEALFASGNKNLARRKLSDRKMDDPESVKRVLELKKEYGV